MSPAVVTWKRTLGAFRSQFSSILAVAGFLSAASASFALSLHAAEGSRTALVPLWATCVAPLVPFLAAFLAMDVWSEERRTGRIDMLLTVAVRERSFVMGKFLGVWSLTMGAVGLFLVETLAVLLWFAPATLADVRCESLLLALLIIMAQSAVWCAASVLMSSAFSHAAAAVCSALALTVGLPRGIWAAIMAWAGEGRVVHGEMPFDAQVVDFASGVVSVGTLFSYLLVAGVLLFLCSKAVASLRLIGNGSRVIRASTALAGFLSLVFAGLCVSLLARTDTSLDIPVSGASASFSPRTRNLLAESSGDIVATCFLSRRDARFREIGHLLRALMRQSKSLGGARFTLRFVDPSWDFGIAEKLVRSGVAAQSLVFERGGRRAVLSLADGYGEREVSSTLRRLLTPIQRRMVCWTVGHGESSPFEYGPFGLSDIARDIVREGFQNAPLDLSSGAAVPGDCALVVVAGARYDFSRAELARLDAYLREGGRLLLMFGSVSGGGLESLASSWGIRPVNRPISGAKTVTGADAIVSDFADHPVSTPLRGARIVLDRPIAFEPTAAVETGVGADRISFVPLAKLGTASLVASVERGVGAGGDLAIRPTRLVAVGDATFAMNGQLSARANANRDFFLNCIAYLSGTDSSGSSGAETDVLVTGMDRDRWILAVAGSSVVVPAAVFLFMLTVLRKRRRRA